MRTPFLALVLGAMLLAPPRRDLDVGVPPGSPLEWAGALPAYTPARAPLFPSSGPGERSGGKKDEGQRSSAKLARSEADVRFANAFGQVRILTWDLGAHLAWTLEAGPMPSTGTGGVRPPPTRFGEPLFWLSLAPLLRLLLHPDSLVRSETLAHLVELGEPTLPVLASASVEPELALACRELRALIRVDQGPLPSAPAASSPRQSALAQVVLEECLRDRPFDPSDDFGRRLYLFAEEAEPLLCAYAEHPSLELARNAVAALARYETRSALAFLAALAARVEDPVTLVRALAALGRYRGPLDTAPLIERLRRTQEPVQRAALIGALGRLGARDAAPLLLELGEGALRARDSDLLISVLSALARISWTQPRPELVNFYARVRAEARDVGKPSSHKLKPDLPDPSGLRAEILTQLALLARSQAAPQDEKLRAEILALARPAPLDARLSELGVGGTDPLGTIPAAVRFLYLEGLLRVGPAGVERLAALVRRAELETALRGRALALLPYDERGALAALLLEEARTPVELRIQALEILIGDLHPRVEALCRAQLGGAWLAQARPKAGDMYLALRALRHLSERHELVARDLLPLYPLVQRPLAEREASVAELRARLGELCEAVRAGGRGREIERLAGEAFDFVLAQRLNALIDPDMRDARVDELLGKLGELRGERTTPEVAQALVPQLLSVLLGGEAEVSDPGRTLFQPSVPLPEEVLLALGRTRDPLALELILSTLQGGARELRAHAALALGMSAQPALAEKLLPCLLDADPFVRFAASESLRHLVGKEPTIDWTRAGAAERQAAAEELKLWLLERKK